MMKCVDNAVRELMAKSFSNVEELLSNWVSIAIQDRHNPTYIVGTDKIKTFY